MKIKIFCRCSFFPSWSEVKSVSAQRHGASSGCRRRRRPQTSTVAAAIVYKQWLTIHAGWPFKVRAWREKNNWSYEIATSENVTQNVGFWRTQCNDLRKTTASYTAVGDSNLPPDRYFRHRVTSCLQACHVACRNFKSLFSMPVCIYRAHSISDAGGWHPAYWFHFQRSNSPRTIGCPQTSLTMHGVSQPKFFNSLRADDCQIRH
jgi:hypothetical protein